MENSEITVKIKVEVEGVDKALRDLRLIQEALTQVSIKARSADFDFNAWAQSFSKEPPTNKIPYAATPDYNQSIDE